MVYPISLNEKIPLPSGCIESIWQILRRPKELPLIGCSIEKKLQNVQPKFISLHPLGYAFKSIVDSTR